MICLGLIGKVLLELLRNPEIELRVFSGHFLRLFYKAFCLVISKALCFVAVYSNLLQNPPNEQRRTASKFPDARLPQKRA